LKKPLPKFLKTSLWNFRRNDQGKQQTQRDGIPYSPCSFTLMKTKMPSFLITLLLFCFNFSQSGSAVTPAPDGGYPGGNTAEGQNALLNLDVEEGTFNTAVGFLSLSTNTNGDFNTALGAGALLSNANATENTATGAGALLNNAAPFVNGGNRNTADGAFALLYNSTGSSNTAIGARALINNTTGSNNIALGDSAGSAVTTANNVICIGTPGANINNSCFIAGIYSNIQPPVGDNPAQVTITTSGRLGRSNVSSRRYKHDIKPLDKASEGIFALKPVSFRYNKQYDATQTIAFGLIAEEVAEVNPALVGRNEKGQPELVRYEHINTMLLNEFLKEHKRVEAQQATITELKSTVAQQQKGMEILTAQLKEQAAQIQKVRTQLEMVKSAPRVVDNNP
jgi:uncharacterized coiled-coil protein SlyX